MGGSMIYLKKSIYVCCVLVVSIIGSDAHKDTSHENIPHSVHKELTFKLSELSPLIGYNTAKKIDTLSVAHGICTMYNILSHLPSDLQNEIFNRPIISTMLQNLYLKSFRKSAIPTTKKSLHRLVTLSVVEDDAIALAQPESFIEVWSISNREKLFTSNQISSVANLYKHPLLISSSPGTYLHIWNADNKYHHSSVKTEHRANISLLFECGSDVVSCSEDGILCIHDIEKFGTKATLVDGHGGALCMGKQVAPAVFITSGYDSCVREWDCRIAKSTGVYWCGSRFIPYGFHSIDETYVIIGGSQNKIYILDRRMNNGPLKQVSNKSCTLDMAALSDNTLVYGDKNINFETWNGVELTEKIRFPLKAQMINIVTNKKDTIVYSDNDGDIVFIQPTSKPYHLTHDASVEQCIMAAGIDSEDGY
jgi:hypothetical protein